MVDDICIHVLRAGSFEGRECGNKTIKGKYRILLLCAKHYIFVNQHQEMQLHLNKLREKIMAVNDNINIIKRFYKNIDENNDLKYSHQISDFLRLLNNFNFYENEIVNILYYLLKKRNNEELIIYSIFLYIHSICLNKKYDLFILVNSLIYKQTIYIDILLPKNKIFPSEINTLILNYLKRIYLKNYINIIKENDKDNLNSNIILKLTDIKL